MERIGSTAPWHACANSRICCVLAATACMTPLAQPYYQNADSTATLAQHMDQLIEAPFVATVVDNLTENSSGCRLLAVAATAAAATDEEAAVVAGGGRTGRSREKGRGGR